MTKSKIISRALTGIVALAMVFGFSEGAFAADGYYVVGSPTQYNHPIDVKVVIESRQDPTTDDQISEVLNVQLGETGVSGQTFTVQDAALEISDNAMAGIKMYDYSYDYISADDDYIFGMEQGDNVYFPGLPMSGYALDGWMFRVNGQIPLLSLTGSAPNGTSPTGASITQTPIADGDVIHFYWDYPFQITSSTYYSAHFVNPAASYSAGTLTVQLQDSYNWFANNYYWTITPFANLALSGKTVTVYDAAGNQIGAPGTTNSTGIVTISGLSLTSGTTYYIKTSTTSFKMVYGYDEDYNILDKTMGYAKFVF